MNAPNTDPANALDRPLATTCARLDGALQLGTAAVPQVRAQYLRDGTVVGGKGQPAAVEREDWDLSSSLTFPQSDINAVNATAFSVAFKETLTDSLNDLVSRTADFATVSAFHEESCTILALSPGSIVVDFSLRVTGAEMELVLSLFAALRGGASNLVVVVDGVTHLANTAYLMTPSVHEVEDTADGAETHCEGADCKARLSCELTPCPEQQWNSTGCTTISAPSFDSVRVMCVEPPCVPVTCGCGVHDCVPVICEGADGVATGGYHCDPCETGHHGDDGLGWWPLLLWALGLSILITAALQKLATGECCGRSINPPFTVVMFFVGYLIAQWVSHEHEVGKTMKDWTQHSHVLIDSVDSWKQTHPHVILFCLLPPLLFEDASSMDFYTFRKVLKSSALLAGPGVLLSMLLTGPPARPPTPSLCVLLIPAVPATVAAALSMAIFGFETSTATDPHTLLEVTVDRCATRNSNSRYQPSLFCMSWCPDFEFRGTQASCRHAPAAGWDAGGDRPGGGLRGAERLGRAGQAQLHDRRGVPSERRHCSGRVHGDAGGCWRLRHDCG